MIGVNDSPELDDTVAADFSSINEDDFNSDGTLIADILARSVSDQDGDPEGIAIFNADQTNGKFEYLVEGATEYVAFGDVSDSSALLLDASTRIRFVPAPDYNGDATISFKAWDQTIGAEGDKIAVAGNSGGTNSLSTGDDTAIITVNPVNDDPVAVDDVGFSTPEDTPLTIPQTELLANDSDVDGDSFGITTIFSPNGTVSISGFGANSMITYTPNENFVGVETLTYVLNDGNGGTAEATIEITVGSVNDAPTTTPVTLTPIAEDSLYVLLLKQNYWPMLLTWMATI